MKRELRDLYHSIIPTEYITVGGAYRNNIVITAPHGGGMKPIFIPKRKYGKLLQDTYTRRIINGIIDKYRADLKPLSLISDIHRSRVDFNRDIIEGAQGNHKAEELWRYWDYKMQSITDVLRNKFKKSLYIDIHSHNDNDSFQLGYNLSARAYNELKNTRFTADKSTLFSLSDDQYNMIFGMSSIKKSLEHYGYSVYSPNGNEVYFNGGRGIETFSGNGIGAIQIEVPVSVAKEDFDGCINALYHAIDVFRVSNVPRN